MIEQAATEIHNELTRAVMTDDFEKLARVIDQQAANSTPVPNPGGPYEIVDALPGQSIRIRLDATGSVDADSTPGTRDNIRHYRWFTDGGVLLGDEAVYVVELAHAGGEGVTEHVLTLEVEDAYGAVDSVPFTVTMMPPESQR